MKKYLCLLIGLLVNATANARDYGVSGFDDRGNYVFGEIEPEGGDNISGTIYSENGTSIEIDGKWFGRGKVEATDMCGNSYTLETE